VEALTQLDAWEVAALLVLGLTRVPTEALMYRPFLPGLGLRRGSEAYLSSNFAGQLLPPPSASVVQYGYLRGAGYAADAAGLAALGSFIFPTIGRFLLPLVAFVLLLFAGEIRVDRAGGFALARRHGGCGHRRLSVHARRALGAPARSEGATALSWILEKLKRDSIEDGAGRAAELRIRALAVLRAGWALGSIGVAVNLFLTYLILLASLRFVGVSSGELTAPDAFAAFAIAFWAGAVLPITGSGLGVVDAVLIAMLIELGGASDDALVAAALLWRVFYSVLVLPLGAITSSRFRKANPDVLRSGTAEARLT
jgi:uncharacterized membrane protein YbhN (UPF0104 family)